MPLYGQCGDKNVLGQPAVVEAMNHDVNACNAVLPYDNYSLEAATPCFITIDDAF